MNDDLYKALLAAQQEENKTNASKLIYRAVSHAITASLVVAVLYSAGVVPNPLSVFIPILTLVGLVLIIPVVSLAVNVSIKLMSRKP